MAVKENTYITIQSFMINELHLKGNALLIYAIIYGFSQDGNQWYTGSSQYLAEWTNTSKRAVYDCLKKLTEDGIIEKKERNINGVKFCDYRAKKNTSDEKTSLPLVKKLHHPSEETSHHNNNTYYRNINKDKDKSTIKDCGDIKLNSITSKMIKEDLLNEIDLICIEDYNSYIEEMLLEYPAHAVASNSVYIMKWINNNKNKVPYKFGFFTNALKKNLEQYKNKNELANDIDNEAELLNEDVDINELDEFLKEFE